MKFKFKIGDFVTLSDKFKLNPVRYTFKGKLCEYGSKDMNIMVGIVIKVCDQYDNFVNFPYSVIWINMNNIDNNLYYKEKELKFYKPK